MGECIEVRMVKELQKRFDSLEKENTELKEALKGIKSQIDCAKCECAFIKTVSSYLEVLKDKG